MVESKFDFSRIGKFQVASHFKSSCMLQTVKEFVAKTSKNVYLDNAKYIE